MKKTIVLAVVTSFVFAMSASALEPLMHIKDMHLGKAMQLLDQARSEVQQASSVNAGGEKAQAIQAINSAIAHLKMAEKKDFKKDKKYDKKHPGNGPA